MIFEIVLIAFILILLFLLVFLYFQNRHINKRLDDLTHGPDSWLMTPDTKMLHSTEEKANLILSQAEIEAIKIASEAKIESSDLQKKVEEVFAESLGKMIKNIETSLTTASNNLNTSIQETEKKHQELITQLQKQDVTLQRVLEEEIRGKINNLLFDFEQKISDFLTTAENRSNEAINLEIKSARQLIESYKTQQINLVDENIVAVLERTLSLVLKKKLSLKDQLDMVYKALEEAKLEKFFV